MNIMFICTGNLCRSVMAQYLLEKRLKELKIDNINVYSCGIYAYNRAKTTREAKYIMKKYYDIDLEEHRALNIENSNIEEMDLILCATENQKEEVKGLYKDLKEKVFTIKEYVGYNEEGHDKMDIQDPWGFDKETYLKCSKEISECIELLLKKLNSK